MVGGCPTRHLHEVVRSRQQRRACAALGEGWCKIAATDGSCATVPTGFRSLGLPPATSHPTPWRPVSVKNVIQIAEHQHSVCTSLISGGW